MSGSSTDPDDYETNIDVSSPTGSMPDGYQSSPTPIDVTADGPDFNIYIQPQYYGPDGEVSSAPVGGGDGSPQLDISSSPDQDSGADSILPSTLVSD